MEIQSRQQPHLGKKFLLHIGLSSEWQIHVALSEVTKFPIII